MKVVDADHAMLTGTVLAMLMQAVDTDNNVGPLGVKEVTPEYQENGDYEAVVNVTTAHGRYQVIIVPAPLVVNEDAAV